jgi:transposase
MLIEAAKFAICFNHELAEIYEKKRDQGNANRATLAAARKLIAYEYRARGFRILSKEERRRQ